MTANQLREFVKEYANHFSLIGDSESVSKSLKFTIVCKRRYYDYANFTIVVDLSVFYNWRYFDALASMKYFLDDNDIVVNNNPASNTLEIY